MQPTDKNPLRAALRTAAAGDLGGVIERARMLVRLGNVRGDKLVFLVGSPVWKAKLRLHADVLLDAARAAGLQPSGLTVKVATMLPVPPDAAPRTPLSAAARDALRAAAHSVADPELRDQLLRMASLA
jgi:hypothetical protein